MTRMLRFADRSLWRTLEPMTFKGRIVALFGALISAISLLIFVFFPAATERQAEDALGSKAQSIADMTSHTVTSAIMFEDWTGVREALEAALQNADVMHIHVADRAGTPLASGGGDEFVVPTANFAHDDWESSERVFTYESPVEFGGERIGTVHVDLSRAQMWADVRSARGFVAILSMLVLLIGLWAAQFIGSRLVAPLASVAAAAEKIANGDLASRAAVPTNDEVGQMARSFNQMVDRVQATQDRLVHSQKMESIGLLAGGIAHDFNNLLASIMSSADLLLMNPSLETEAREDVTEILLGGERAASLIGQLLAFSRKQVSQPQVLNLNRTVAGLESMLKRLIGEDLLLNTDLGGQLFNIEADPSQLEQVIVNLAVNARDAMVGGGTLHLRTRNLLLDYDLDSDRAETIPAGPYVVFTVTDTGTGMSEETLSRIFEPFFTSKKNGTGTGLGLATAYGIVQQSGGFIRVHSQVDVGTSFEIFFPRAEGDCVQAPSRLPGEKLETGDETILLAEDQDDVRRTTAKILEKCGYRVLTAPGGDEALRMAVSSTEPIDLLLTDVVMPGMSGGELACALALEKPEIAVIYMSGYTDDQLARHGVLDEDIKLIQKPFAAHHLAATVRAVLDRSSRAGSLTPLPHDERLHEAVGLSRAFASP